MEEPYHIKQLIPVTQEPIPNTLTRRQSLKWLGVVTAGISLPLLSGCEGTMVSAAKLAGNWPDLDLKPITGKGYGKDPNQITPPGSPWPLTMTAHQRKIATLLVDIIIPREGDQPSASEVGVTELLDEWISAPYPSYQSDRVEILSALTWLDEESERRFDTGFTQTSASQRLAIIDDIAYEEAESQLRFAYISRVFDAMRTLTVIPYSASPEGTKEIGYQGNIPIAGDYPGPSVEAMEHLEVMLRDLDLEQYVYLGPTANSE